MDRRQSKGERQLAVAWAKRTSVLDLAAFTLCVHVCVSLQNDWHEAAAAQSSLALSDALFFHRVCAQTQSEKRTKPRLLNRLARASLIKRQPNTHTRVFLCVPVCVRECLCGCLLRCSLCVCECLCVPWVPGCL